MKAQLKTATIVTLLLIGGSQHASAGEPTTSGNGFLSAPGQRGEPVPRARIIGIPGAVFIDPSGDKLLRPSAPPRSESREEAIEEDGSAREEFSTPPIAIQLPDDPAGNPGPEVRDAIAALSVSTERLSKAPGLERLAKLVATQDPDLAARLEAAVSDKTQRAPRSFGEIARGTSALDSTSRLAMALEWIRVHHPDAWQKISGNVLAGDTSTTGATPAKKRRPLMPRTAAMLDAIGGRISHRRDAIRGAIGGMAEHYKPVPHVVPEPPAELPPSFDAITRIESSIRLAEATGGPVVQWPVPRGGKFLRYGSRGTITADGKSYDLGTDALTYYQRWANTDRFQKNPSELLRRTLYVEMEARNRAKERAARR